jgi:hypothetical protein
MAAADVVINVVSTIIVIFVNAFAIWLTVEKILRYVSYKDEGFKTALKIAAIAGLVSFVLSLVPMMNPALVGNVGLNFLFFLVNAGLVLYLIKRFYELDWGKSAVAWLIVLVLGFVIGFAVGNVIGLVRPIFGF